MPGNWVWSVTHSQPVAVIERQDDLPFPSVRIWIPGTNTVVMESLNNLIPLSQSPPPNFNEILITGLAAKIFDLLSHSPFISPFEARLIPLPHQIAAMKKACKKKDVRFLLADEVGLGKTIEAGLILKELKIRGKVRRILILAPKGLVIQWSIEMKNRFHENFPLIIPREDVGITGTIENPWLQYEQIIAPIDAVKPIRRRRGWDKDKIREYNQRRFHDLVNSGWDLVIIDEAHKLAGTSQQVARHQLGKALSRMTPHLLLLSATPHQGKTEAFIRLMGLLNPVVFNEGGEISPEHIQEHVIRTEKRNAVDENGKLLFLPRSTSIIHVAWEEHHALQKELYEKVTEYVRTGYNQAITEKRNYIGFLMVLMQRLVSSSTRSIRTTLERRLSVLEQQRPSYNQIERVFEEWDEDDFDVDGIVETIPSIDTHELKTVNSLLDLARRCEIRRPDAKAEKLIELMQSIRSEENDPALKFLIFTEFVPTQEMLTEYLSSRGYSVVCLNGSMDMEERIVSQKAFATGKEVMISTEAGGEGLNLQFCHVAINYDMPWNPMRLEQRIGRVDRIGQKYPVRIFNFVFSGTIEERVYEVLLEKLLVILNDLGFDKIGDILDSADAEKKFGDLFIHSLIEPEKTDIYIDDFIRDITRTAKSERESLNYYLSYEQLPIEDARRYHNHPLPILLERLITTVLPSFGGQAIRGIEGYTLIWPDGYIMDNVIFSPDENESPLSSHLSISNPRIISLLNNFPYYTRDRPLSRIRIKGFPKDLLGIWSLWLINSDSGAFSQRFIPHFVSNNGQYFRTTAIQIWDGIVQGEFEVKISQQENRNQLEKIRSDILLNIQSFPNIPSQVSDIRPILYLEVVG